MGDELHRLYGIQGDDLRRRGPWPACGEQVTRVVMRPDGLPLDYGCALRLVPAHIRRAFEVRDGGCVFAG